MKSETCIFGVKHPISEKVKCGKYLGYCKNEECEGYIDSKDFAIRETRNEVTQQIVDID